MMRRNVILAAALLALPMAATAQPVTGPYISLGVGGNYLSNWNANNISGPRSATVGTFQTNNIHVRSSWGPVGLGAFGYGLGNGVRLEVEGDYRSSGGGRTQTYGGMLNALYDFDIGYPWIFPYVGAGIGYEEVRLRSVGISGNTIGTGLTNIPAGTPFAAEVGGSKGGLAVQGIVGAAFPISSVPGLSVTTEFRYMGAALTDITYGGTVAVGHPTNSIQAFNTKFGTQNNFAGLIGIRYVIGVAPPPPPPPVAQPAPAPARTYLVFFDWDKADLTDRARQIIAEAAQASTHVNTTQIEVDGHADLSGTPQYNQKLGLRRAQAVGAELVKNGVPQNIIFIQSFGDTRPLVPTARGVREPQNRRVEIILK
jgi:outer membrane protein OmpA-like peptidoglycan-associated protein